MSSIENKIAEYLNNEGMHKYVFYQVTPKYVNDNPIASSVTIKAYTIEDNELCIDDEEIYNK